MAIGTGKRSEKMEPSRDFSSPSHTVEGKETSRISRSQLHSVRRSPSKPWKKAAAPATLTRVYVVEPHGFRLLVQKLTGAPQVPSRRLQEVAPPPLSIMPPPPCGSPVLDVKPEINCSSLIPHSTASSFTSSIGFLSPSSYFSLCSLPLLSPGTMASLEQSAVL